MKKTFKIGERAKGGIIVAIIHREDIELECRDWDSKELLYGEISDDESFLLNVLLDWTDYYHADMIIDWLKLNAKGIL